MTKKTVVFFSYARADIEPLMGDDTSWLDEIQDRIQRAIGANNPRVPFKVWTDKSRIVAGESIDSAIEPALAACDMAVAFISKHYIFSRDCARELRELHRMGKPIIIVEMEKDWHTVSNTELGDLGHQIYKVERLLCTPFWTEEDGATALLGSPRPSRASAKDTERLQQQLKAVKKAIETYARAAPPSTPHFVTDLTDPADNAQHDLFLACPTRDAHKHVMRLKKSLEDKGYDVATYDLASEEVEGWTMETLTERIAACHHYAQIVGAVPGKADLFDSGKSLVAAQFDAAEAKGVPTSLMLSPEVYVEDCDGTHRAFLDACNCQPTTVEAFEEYLVKCLDAARERATIIQRRSEKLEDLPGHDGKLIAIDFDPKADRDKYEKLATRLTQQKNVAIFDTITDDLSADILKAAVGENDAVLVVYSDNERSQIRAKRHFKDFWKFCRSQKSVICRLAVGDAAPHAINPPPMGDGIYRIRVHDEVDEGDLHRFFQGLGLVPEPAAPSGG